MKQKPKVFLGGTCANSTWRNELIPLLEAANIDYFNPIVEDWTEACIEIEENEKWIECDVHLYMLTKEMKGVYSLIEFIDSYMQPVEGIKPMLVINTDGMEESMIKSLRASIKKIEAWNIRHASTTYIYITDNQEKAFNYILNNINR